MKLKSYLEKNLQKALSHQDEHPVSGSAARDVNACIRALNEYLSSVDKFKAKDKK